MRRGRVVGVIDLRHGRAVHARGGDRTAYLPVANAVGTRIDGDPIALARAYVEQLGVRELYVADLDAIAGGTGALQGEILGDIASLGVPLWVDAGVSDSASAQLVRGAGAAIDVVGLETLGDLDALEHICSTVGGAHVAFSLDLRDGRPIVAPNVGHAGATPSELAARGRRAGVGTIVVLDLARVGMGSRIDGALLASIRAVVPEVALFVGGGVKDALDLETAREAGCEGVLVASALLSGAIDV